MINIFVDNLAPQDASVSAAMIMTKLAWYIWAYRTGQVNPSNIIHKKPKHFLSHCLMLLYAIQDPMCPPGKCIRILRLIIQNIFFTILWFYFNVNPLALAPPKFHGLSCFYVFYGLWYYMNCKTIFQHIEWFFFNLNHWQSWVLSFMMFSEFFVTAFFFTFYRKPFFSMLCHSSFMWALPSNSPSCILWCTISCMQPEA